MIVAGRMDERLNMELGLNEAVFFIGRYLRMLASTNAITSTPTATATTYVMPLA